MKLNMKRFKTISNKVSRHSPEILTGLGIAGMVTATVLAVKATPKALKLIEEEKNMRAESEEGGVETSLKPIEIIKVAWKPYIPVGITILASSACLIGARSVDLRRSAALTAAYKLSEAALSDYREKVIETVGDEKETIIREKVAEKHLKSKPLDKKQIITTERGSTLCFDVISGRYFKSDIESIKKAQNELNRRMLNDMYLSLNDFYDEIGLAHIGIGDSLGWSVDDGLLDLYFSSQLAEDGTPCVVVEYHTPPKYDY